MRSILEYLQSGHIINTEHKINSSDDLRPGDYFRVEWGYGGYDKYWLIGKFNSIGLYTPTSNFKSVIYDYCVSNAISTQNPKVQINGHNGLEKDAWNVNNIKVVYKNATEDDIDLLHQIEDYIHANKKEKLIGTGRTYNIGELVQGKIIWE